MGVNLAPFERGLNAAAARFRAFGATLAGVGASISAAGMAVVAPFLQGLSVFSEFGTEMVATMRMTGIEFSALDEIMDGTRASAESLVPAIAKMSAMIGEAAQGGKEANEHLQRMGLSVEELQGLSQGERFMRIADGLNSIADAGQRIAAQRAVFGRGGLAINISGGAAGVRARAARQDEVEGVQTPQDLAAARAYNEALREMKLAITGVWFAIGRAAVPLMTEFTQLVVRIVIRIREWIEENRYLLDILFRVADKVVAVGFAVVGFAGIAYAASTALSVLAFALKATGIALVLKAAGLVIAKVAVWLYNAAIATASFLTALLTGEILVLVGVLGGLAIVAVVAAAAALLIYQNWDSFVTYMSEWIPIFERFGETMTAVFRGIGDAIYAGDWVMAMEIAWAGIKLVWTRGVNFLASGWDSLILLLANAMIDLAETIEELFANIFNAIASNINTVIDSIPEWVREQTGIERVGDMTRTNFEGIRRTMGADWQQAELERNAAERAAQAELDGLIDAAWLARVMADWERDNAGIGLPGDVGGAGGEIAKKSSIFGGFSAGAIFGALGARQVSEAERAERQRDKQLAAIQQVVKELREIAARVAPQFG